MCLIYVIMLMVYSHSETNENPAQIKCKKVNFVTPKQAQWPQISLIVFQLFFKVEIKNTLSPKNDISPNVRSEPVLSALPSVT
jgi:hypothetical protein